LSRTNPRIQIPAVPNEPTLMGGPSIVVPVGRTSELAVRRIRWSFVLLPLFLIGLAIGVLNVARSERSLEAEGAKATRVIVYQLDTGHELRLAIEPGTDVFRVLMHAARTKEGQDGPEPLSPQAHMAKIHFRAKGDLGTLDDLRSISLPGTTSRVTAEDPDLVVGDPIGTSIDVHDVGVGELSMTLDSLDAADALLVRIYRREQVHAVDAMRRSDHLDESRRTHYAHRAGEIDWVDLDDDEQIAILGSKWKKTGALSGSNDIVARAIALAPPEERAPHVHDDVGIATFTIVGDERASFVAHGPTTVHGRIDDPDAPLSATVRYEDGTVANVAGNGELVMKVPDGNVVGVELTAPGDRPIEVRAVDPKRVEPPTRAAYWRASSARPAMIAGGPDPLIVRVTARRGVPRTASEMFPINLAVTATSRTGATTTSPVHAERARSRFDRYESRDPAEAPTDKLVFYVVVPPGGTTQITPLDATLDLSLAELDPSAGARPIASYSPGSKHDPIAKIGEVDWDGFVPRRPSNGPAFEPDAHGLVRVAHRYVSVPESAEKPPSFRIARPRLGDAIKIQDRIFDPASAKLEFDVVGGQHVTLPVHIYSPEPVTVTARVDDGEPRRIAMGVAARVTVDRKVDVVGERKAVVVLGDDLAPGKHTLSFDVDGGKKAWVHVPWLKLARRAPSSTGTTPRWVEGEFDN
jgi:hypothetical protein